MHSLPEIVRAIALNNKIDESRDFAEMVREYLTLTNRYRVDVAESGFEAGLMVARARPDLIVLDLVLPRTTPLAQTPVSARLRGLTGPHTSRRLGDGTELRDIAPLLPGDPVRRVDWRVTARRSPTRARPAGARPGS